MKYFIIDKAMSSTKGEYMVWFKAEEAARLHLIGSLNVAHSRIFGLSYPQFLRYVRDTYNARIAGKGHKYPNFYFPTEQDAKNYASVLDKRYSEIRRRLINLT